MLPPTDVTLAVLAGGQGSRMGQPKGDLRVNGVPLAEYLLRAIDWTGPTLLVTAPGREHPPGAEAYDAEATDPEFGAGPLRGVLTALEHARTSLAIIVALDMPRVGRPQLEWLAGQLRSAPHAAGIMCRANGQLEPLPFIVRTDEIPLVRTTLTAGRRSLRSLLDAGRVELIDAPAEWPVDVWTNVNAPADWESFLRSAGETN